MAVLRSINLGWTKTVAVARAAAYDRGGAVLVEFALTLPLLLLLLAGGYEFGRLMWHHHLVNKGVRDATRYLARMDNPTDGAAVAQARQLLITGSLDAGAPALIADWVANPGLVQVAVTEKAFANTDGEFHGLEDGVPVPVKVVSLTATVTYQGVGLLSLIGFPNGLTYTASHEQRFFSE